MKDKMNILLPIETINREIDYKLVLAAYLAGKGYNVYVGQHNFIDQLLPRLDGGIYIGKTMFKSLVGSDKGDIYKVLRKQNFDFIYLNEEGAVFKGEEDDWRQMLNFQYDMKLFNANDIVCTWGEFQLEHDQKRNFNNVPIKATGHPRFDLYKQEWNFLFKDEIIKLKQKYKDFILVNGNFGLANHGQGVSYVFSSAGHYNVKDVSKRMDRIGFYTHSTKQLVEMVKLTHQLAIHYPSKIIIYRPHPSENIDYYKSIFKGVNNIIVEHRGSVNAWILAAKFIIHDGCTTAIEAALGGKVVINYKTAEDLKHDIWLPNQMGIKTSSFNEVINIIDNYKESRNVKTYTSKAKNLLQNFETNSFKAFFSILDYKLNEMNHHKFENKLTQKFISWQYFKNKLKVKIASVIPQKKQAIQYHRNKFNGFDEQNINLKIDLLEKNFDKSITLKYYNPFLIKIT